MLQNVHTLNDTVRWSVSGAVIRHAASLHEALRCNARVSSVATRIVLVTTGAFSIVPPQAAFKANISDNMTDNV